MNKTIIEFNEKTEIAFLRNITEYERCDEKYKNIERIGFNDKSKEYAYDKSRGKNWKMMTSLEEIMEFIDSSVKFVEVFATIIVNGKRYIRSHIEKENSKYVIVFEDEM